MIEQTQEVRKGLDGIVALLKGHAKHEDKAIHELLRQKKSTLQVEVEKEHEEQDASLNELQRKIEAISECKDARERVRVGYEFYLAYRKFVGENLLHLHHEETVLMPELQRICTEEELRAVEWATYQLMEPEHMVHMLKSLAPHMNPDDHEYFISDMHTCAPGKFAKAWPGIVKVIGPDESEELQEKLGISVSEEPYEPAQAFPYAWEEAETGSNH